MTSPTTLRTSDHLRYLIRLTSTSPIAIGGFQCCMLQHPTNRGLGFYQPFSWDIWLALIFLYLFYCLLLYLFSTLSKKVSVPSGQREEDFSLGQCFDYFFLSSIQFGADTNPKSVSGKILRVFWSFFTIILVATYTANLSAIFSQSAYYRPLKSIEEIQASNRNLVALKQYGTLALCTWLKTKILAKLWYK